MINFSNSLLILLVIFISVFSLILLTRLIFALLIHFAIKKYGNLKNRSEKKKNDIKKTNKEDDELMKYLDEIPKAHSQTRAHNLQKNKAMQKGGNYELMVSKEQQLEKDEMNQVNIVDIVKPVGFWTSVILGQKLTYLIQSAQIINKRGKQGFWVSMIEAQEQAAGRQHSRGR